MFNERILEALELMIHKEVQERLPFEKRGMSASKEIKDITRPLLNETLFDLVKRVYREVEPKLKSNRSLNKKEGTQ